MLYSIIGCVLHELLGKLTQCAMSRPDSILHVHTLDVLINQR